MLSWKRMVPCRVYSGDTKLATDKEQCKTCGNVTILVPHPPHRPNDNIKMNFSLNPLCFSTLSSIPDSSQHQGMPLKMKHCFLMPIIWFAEHKQREPSAWCWTKMNPRNRNSEQERHFLHKWTSSLFASCMKCVSSESASLRSMAHPISRQVCFADSREMQTPYRSRVRPGIHPLWVFRPMRKFSLVHSVLGSSGAVRSSNERVLILRTSGRKFGPSSRVQLCGFSHPSVRPSARSVL